MLIRCGLSMKFDIMSVESSIPRPLEVIYNELAMSLCFIYRAQVGCPLWLGSRHETFALCLCPTMSMPQRDRKRTKICNMLTFIGAPTRESADVQYLTQTPNRQGLRILRLSHTCETHFTTRWYLHMSKCLLPMRQGIYCTVTCKFFS